MNDDELLRSVVIGCFALLLPAMMYYRVRSQASGERLDRRKEGVGLMVGIRLFGLMNIGGVIAFMVDPDNLAWSRIPLPVGLRLGGAAAGLLSGGLIIWAFHHLGKNLTDTVVTRAHHTLIQSGPYRWVRHPFYCAMALTFLSNSLATANWFIFATGCLTFALIVVRTSIEEAHLVARFGGEYERYMLRTGRFFPRHVREI